jgi:hypothetical protein
MNDKEFESAFDTVIKMFNEEASKSKISTDSFARN